MLCYVMLLCCVCYVCYVYVSCRVVSCRVVSCRVVSCYVMLCYVMLCYVMLCYVMLCYVMLCYVMLCYVMLCYVMLCYVMSCRVVSCRVVSCRVVSCRVVSCHVMSCYVMFELCATKVMKNIFFLKIANHVNHFAKLFFNIFLANVNSTESQIIFRMENCKKILNIYTYHASLISDDKCKYSWDFFKISINFIISYDHKIKTNNKRLYPIESIGVDVRLLVASRINSIASLL